MSGDLRLTAEDCASCVGPGWHKLVTDLHARLLSLGWDGEVHQVKEKWGGLRFYIGYGSDEIFDAIDEAERASLRICEQCGSPGRPGGKGWILTLCEPCRTARKVP